MAWTKRKFIQKAYEELNLAGSITEMTPENMILGLDELDNLMSQWFTLYGMDIGYPLPVTTTDLDDATTIDYSANDAVVLALAVALASRFGKVLRPQTFTRAAETFGVLHVSVVGIPSRMRNPALAPKGAGQKSPGAPFFEDE